MSIKKSLSSEMLNKIDKNMNWASKLHGSLSDQQIQENYRELAGNLNYSVISVIIDRQNQYAPLLVAHVHPTDRPNDQRVFSYVLLGPAANIGLIIKVNGENHILVRNQDKGASINVLAVPGGRAEFCDSDITDTAVRELSEEVGGVKIPSGSKVWVSNNNVVPVANNAATTDTTVLIWINDEQSKTTMGEIDPKKWKTMPVAKAASMVDHGPSNRAAMAAYIFQLGGTIEGKTFTR